MKRWIATLLLVVAAVGATATFFLTRHPNDADGSAAAPPSTPAAAANVERRTQVALVVGNGSYGEASLDNPVNDARLMAATLRSFGFYVVEKQNVSQNELRQAVREFGDALQKNGTAVFYYAGHGVQHKGRNYLIPVSADIRHEDEIEDQGIDANLVLAKMDSAKSRFNLVILDACRNNPFAKAFQTSSAGLAPMDAPTGTLVAFATAPGQVAEDGTGTNGLYTRHLVENMRVAGLPIEEVFKRTRVQVRTESEGRQIPWENTSLEENYSFVPAPSTVANATQAESVRPDPLAASAQRDRQAALEQRDRWAASGSTSAGRPSIGSPASPPAASTGAVTTSAGSAATAAGASSSTAATSGAPASGAPSTQTVARPAADSAAALSLRKDSAGAAAAAPRIGSSGAAPGTLPVESPAAVNASAPTQPGSASPAGPPMNHEAAAVQPTAARALARDGAIDELVAAYRRQDYALAFRLAVTAGERGNAIAQYHLGEMYRMGRGTEASPLEALKWYRRAGEQGNVAAQEWLGRSYASGLGVARDYPEALKWYRRAADQGSAVAQNGLGSMYRTGQGVQQSTPEAIHWYELAAAQGNSEAQYNLQMTRGQSQ